MTADIYEEVHNVPFFFTNSNGEMSLSALLNSVLLVSENQLVKLNLDGESMLTNGFGWVVTQYHIDITKMPKINEQIKISTQAKSYNKFFCYRDFWIKDMDDNVLVKIESIFVLIDIKDRSIAKVKDEYMNKLGSEKVARPEKFPRLKKTDFKDNEQKIHIGYYNIDINQHVNNSYYFDWILDNMEMDFLKTHQVKTLDIKYEQELTYGDNPSSYMKLEDDISYHRIQNGDKNNMEAMIKWQ
ncbi:acyl-ACP thioesterase [Companilactobacillus sp. RD055328]|uniref:acyl-[acyl-carrier-protein] thioesterase n=1 Tax=Companilactobacillus sp. RD055328 TaxID=2916634 RepID=UPI001FC811B0|nr:acyl-ACP thioesterase domain-containing protein [Companilactobacillus sp. RD055328]GKQ42151.1 acyl-ACP thioesterase [Companilactobacillus sp. RD055328]